MWWIKSIIELQENSLYCLSSYKTNASCPLLLRSGAARCDFGLVFVYVLAEFRSGLGSAAGVDCRRCGGSCFGDSRALP